MRPFHFATKRSLEFDILRRVSVPDELKQFCMRVRVIIASGKNKKIN